MDFRTSFSYKHLEKKLRLSVKVLCLGSCFAENIGAKMEAVKMDIGINPLGIIYNPISLSQLIVDCGIKHNKVSLDELYNREGIYSHSGFHSQWNKLNPEEYVNDVNKALSQFHPQLSSANSLILTLGTSWVYKEKETNKIVSNCHKRSAEQFTKYLLRINEIADSLQSIVSHLDSSTHIILTVSPVRHIKDGFIENTRSKARLIEAIHHVVDQHNHVEYFPSYELMMDDLRDYRFYGSDMLHPSEQAIDYIWSEFRKSSIDHESNKWIDQIEKINVAMKHRPFNPSSLSHIAFCRQQIATLEKLGAQFTFLDFSDELRYFAAFI